jgi:hypothetical protein
MSDELDGIHGQIQAEAAPDQVKERKKTQQEQQGFRPGAQPEFFHCR